MLETVANNVPLNFPFVLDGNEIWRIILGYDETSHAFGHGMDI
jgi:hypothetical protein